MSSDTSDERGEEDVVQQRLVRRFWSEFMEPAELDAEELAQCDPQEMAIFAFLVGSGLSWDDARQSENLDILEANVKGLTSANPNQKNNE